MKQCVALLLVTGQILTPAELEHTEPEQFGDLAQKLENVASVMGIKGVRCLIVTNHTVSWVDVLDKVTIKILGVDGEKFHTITIHKSCWITTEV